MAELTLLDNLKMRNGAAPSEGNAIDVVDTTEEVNKEEKPIETKEEKEPGTKETPPAPTSTEEVTAEDLDKQIADAVKMIKGIPEDQRTEDQIEVLNKFDQPEDPYAERITSLMAASGIELGDEEEAYEGEEGYQNLVERIQKEAVSSFRDKLPEELKIGVELVADHGKAVEDYLDTLLEEDYKNVNLQDPNAQAIVLYDKLTQVDNMTKDKAKKRINDLHAANPELLAEEAKDAQQVMIKAHEDKLKAKLEAAEQEKAARDTANQQEAEKVKKVFLENTEIPELKAKLNAQQAKALHNYANKKDKDGNTGLDKALKDPKTRQKVAYFLKNGIDLNAIEKKGRSKANKDTLELLSRASKGDKNLNKKGTGVRETAKTDPNKTPKFNIPWLDPKKISQSSV